MNVLHIQSSPRGDKSNSIALPNAFLSASRKVLPAINEDILNIWNESLPESQQFPRPACTGSQTAGFCTQSSRPESE
jgi:FMN-dependent NADH-azoreductase